MEVALIYLHVTAKGYPEAAPPEYYLPFSQRWVDTYRKLDSGYPHQLHIVFCGRDGGESERFMYRGLYATFHTYKGAGSDIGACQSAMREIKAQFAVSMSTPVYFWREGWLKKMVEAREFFGDGLYGPMASYEVRPHIRTSCWAVDPATFAKYPHIIDTREKCCWAESFDRGNELWQITNWYASIGKPQLMVTWDQVLASPDWRKPKNIFRRGDESNCIIHDQHTDVYLAAHYHERLGLERLADGR